MPTEYSYDFFLSYSSADKEKVSRLAKRLSESGCRVWFDLWAIGYTVSISAQIEDGIRKARYIVLCLSPNWFTSTWAQIEKELAQIGKGDRIIQVLLDDCEPIPPEFRRKRWIDFRKKIHKSGCADLLKLCRLRRRQQRRPEDQIGRA